MCKGRLRAEDVAGCGSEDEVFEFVLGEGVWWLDYRGFGSRGVRFGMGSDGLEHSIFFGDDRGSRKRGVVAMESEQFTPAFFVTFGLNF